MSGTETANLIAGHQISNRISRTFVEVKDESLKKGNCNQQLKCMKIGRLAIPALFMLRVVKILLVKTPRTFDQNFH